MQDPNTKTRGGKHQHSPGALADSPPTKRQRTSAPFPTAMALGKPQRSASGVQRNSGAGNYLFLPSLRHGPYVQIYE